MNSREGELFSRTYKWCEKYELLFRLLHEDEELKEFLCHYNVYQPPEGHYALYRLLHECMDEAYDCDVVISNYSQVIEEGQLSIDDVESPSEDFVKKLSIEQILACIAWHFRRDHFSEGSWISQSVAEGYMYVLVRGMLRE